MNRECAIFTFDALCCNQKCTNLALKKLDNNEINIPFFSSVFVNPINVHFIKATILLKNLKRLANKPKTCWSVFTYSKPFSPQQTRICGLFFTIKASNSTTCQLTSNIEQLTSRKSKSVRPIMRNMCQFDNSYYL